MNKYILVIIVIFTVGMIWWSFIHHSKLISLETQTIQQPVTSVATKQGIINQQSHSQPVVATTAAIPPAVMEYVEKLKADPQYDWKQPINFYGRVVDEGNAAIIGASVHFTWTDISEKGTSDSDTISDNNGGFSLTGKHGKRMSVTVSKNGYYTYPSENMLSFEYANPADGLFTPDANNPVVFHLRKKGVGANLIISQNGMSTFLNISPPTNGTPVFLDFFNQKVGETGQLKIEGWKEHKDFKTAQNNWGFRLTVPNGGLVENTDEFSFDAPDTDYQSVIEWHFSDGDTGWQGRITKKYYIKFGTPPHFGKISVDTGAFTATVNLEYAINPDGSRNLEPK